MKNGNRLPIKKQKEIAARLKKLRTSAGYTQNGIAEKISVTPKTYREWEVGKYGEDDTFYYPAIGYDNLLLLSEIYHVSTDYLLCHSNCTSVDNHYISLKTGLSDEAIKRITSKNDNTPNQDFLDSFILSEEYIEISHSMNQIATNCHNISWHFKSFNEIKAALQNVTNNEEFEKLDTMLENYANKMEHNGSQIQYLIYQCSLSFGNFLNKIKQTWDKEVQLTLKSMEAPLPGLNKPKKR